MLETFKARLKAKATAAGANLSQKRIDAIADKLNKKYPDITDEAEHDTHIEDLYDADTLKEMASFDDHNRSKAAKEEAERKKKEKEDVDRKKSEEGKNDSPDEPAWFKAFREKTEAELGAIRAEKTQSTIKQQIAAKLKDVPADFYEEWALPSDETGIDAFTEKVTTKYGAIEQGLREKGLLNTKPSGGSKGGGGNGKASTEEIKSITQAIMPRI